MLSLPEHPPPSYLERDTDLISLHSAAPSYTSSLPPTYTPRIRQYSSLLPPAPANSTPIPTHHAYNVASWPSLSNQSQSRAYLNVAARRARRAQEAEQDERDAEFIRRVTQVNEEPSSSAPSGSSTTVATIGMDEALQMESRAWDFFTAQISSWEQREISWRAFRAKHERTQKKGKSKIRRVWGLYGRLA